eukprot:268302-Alexandrium_andersonii.AAC.1
MRHRGTGSPTMRLLRLRGASPFHNALGGGRERLRAQPLQRQVAALLERGARNARAEALGASGS